MLKPPITPQETVVGLINRYYNHDEADMCTFYSAPETLCFYEDHPIYYPNELLLEKLPNKLAVKRLSEIRVRLSHTKMAWLSEKLKERKDQFITKTKSCKKEEIKDKGKKRFNPFSRRHSNSRSSTSGSPPKDIAYNSSAGSVAGVNITEPSNQSLYSLASAVTSSSCDTLNTSPHFKSFYFSPSNMISRSYYKEKESSHMYLTHGFSKGNLFVTTQRILFSPVVKRNTSLLPTLDNSEFSLNIADIDTMKVIQSSRGQWFFVAYEDLFVFTIPFKSKNKAIHFLKLVSNIRFETMISKNLTPMYEFDQSMLEADDCSNVCSPSNSNSSTVGHSLNKAAGDKVKTTCNCFQLHALHIPTACCSTCFHLSYSSFLNSNTYLPSYDESEHAVGLYLQHLNLISDALIYDRTDLNIDPEALLSAAAGPPAFDFLGGCFSTGFGFNVSNFSSADVSTNSAIPSSPSSAAIASISTLLAVTGPGAAVSSGYTNVPVLNPSLFAMGSGVLSANNSISGGPALSMFDYVGSHARHGQYQYGHGREASLEFSGIDPMSSLLRSHG